MIEAVVFDMDGVIIDSEPIWQRVRARLVDEHGGVWTTEDGDRCRGLASGNWSARMAQRLDQRLAAAEIFDLTLQGMVAEYEAELPTFPGAIETVELIASEYAVAVASGSPRALIDVVLHQSGLDRVCEAVGYGDEAERGKPAPDIYLDVVRRLGVEPASAVGVEDSESGLTAVQSAGMHSVAVVSPNYVLSNTVLGRAVLVLQSLSELTPGMIRSLGA